MGLGASTLQTGNNFIIMDSINNVYGNKTKKKLFHFMETDINLLKTKRRPLYLKTQSVPRSKHFSSGL